MTSMNSTKRGRKQNRSCDQCRKGKRACDAAILEDALMRTNKPGNNPTIFHYSDAFGPLAPCGNCQKIKKSCTFDWLRSLRVSQATQPLWNTTLPAKRRQNGRCFPRTLPDNGTAVPQVPEVEPTSQPNVAHSAEFVPFFDFVNSPAGMPTFDLDPGLASITYDSHMSYDGISTKTNGFGGSLDDIFVDSVPCDSDLDKSLSLGTFSECVDDDSTDNGNVYMSYTDRTRTSNNLPAPNGTVMPTSKRRCGRGSSRSNGRGASPFPATTFASNILLSTNRELITEGLLKIYHDSFENALSCWLTERTCPYIAKADFPMHDDDSGPQWNRIYHRVFRLDKVPTSIRGRRLTPSEDKAASKALNLAILAFATQWAQASERSESLYPFSNDSPRARNQALTLEELPSTRRGVEFDRALQLSTWHEARTGLQDAGEIESFRVVLAQIIFALTQRPADVNYGRQNTGGHVKGRHTGIPVSTSIDGEGGEISEYDDLLSKVDLEINAEGPPVYLEQALRLIHSLRARMAMSGGTPLTASEASRYRNQRYSAANSLDDVDRATVDQLFWLGVMFDTLSSVMHKRPLVVSDEDSDISAKESRPLRDSIDGVSQRSLDDNIEGLWGRYLFKHQGDRSQEAVVRWPCSFDQAASLLRDAAPVKVLLFRKIAKIQTLLTRKRRGEIIENAIREALDVYDYWGSWYGPFIRDCVQNHDCLPSRTQSWYICLTGHWHLSTLLLADFVEIIDASHLGVGGKERKRVSSEFITRFRQTNCRILSDLARCSCPREDASFSFSREFHPAVNQGALLTEPWTEVLIRAFAKAGTILLSVLPSQLSTTAGQNDVLSRADDCIKALWYLGRKSDMALSVAKVLGDVLQKRRHTESEVSNLFNFLGNELWY